MGFKVIYMTGAPAAGKSTVCRGLLALRSDLKVFEYGKEMAAHLQEKGGRRASISRANLRAGTSPFVTQEDIDLVDRLSFEYVAKWRKDYHVIIDNHHVTKEQYGFRVSPFTVEKIKQLGPTEIWVLFITSEETILRITGQPEGRTVPTSFEANFHTFLQASLATAYSIVGGIPTFLFDASSRNDELIQFLSGHLDRT